MKLRAQLLGAVLFVGVTTSPARAEAPRDAADLFPAQTLAYLEFRQPDRLSREVAALLRGSALEDLPATLAKHREKRGDDNGFFAYFFLAEFGMFASPEVVAEFGRLQGGAVALTGFSKDMEPEVVGILLSGTSHAPTFVMRTILSVDGSFRIVGECEGIPLYREKRVEFRALKKGDNTPPPPAQPHGPTYALLSDGFIIGTTTDSVKEMVRRLKGKTADPALSSVAAFRDAAKLRDKPGLFGYADLGALNVGLEEAMKNARAPAQLEWDRIKALLNPKAGRQATLSFTLQNGSVELNCRLSLDGNETSPLVDLLPDKKSSVETLHFVPKDARIALAVALSENEKRWRKGLAIVDALAKLEGKRAGDTTRKQIAELEKLLKLDLGKDVIGKVTEAAFVVDPVLLSGHENPLKMVVLTATDTAAAKALDEDLLPKLAALIPPGQAKPTREKIQGHDISVLPLELLGPGTRLHYGRHGKTLVLGLDAAETAEALTAGAKKAGLLADAKTAAAIKEAGDASIVGVVPLSSVLPLLLPDESARRMQMKAGPGGPPAPPPKGTDPTTVKLTKDLAKVMEPLPPATLAIERKADQVTLVIRQPNLKLVSAKVVTHLVDATLEKMFNPGGGAAEVVPAPPPPPPPKD